MADKITISSASKSQTSLKLLNGGKFALGFVSALVFIVLFSVFLDIFGWKLSQTELLIFVPSILTLLVALAALFVSFQAVSEQRIMRQAGTDPVILAHLGKREDTPQMTMFCLTNVGAGVARSVQVRCANNAPDEQDNRVWLSPAKISHPIQAIRQNETVEFNFGVGHKLLSNPPLPPFDVIVDGSVRKLYARSTFLI